MPVLTTQQRNTLESAVKQARKLSESGARNALKAIAVDNPEPFPHMNPEQRSLRNRLRTKARLLGDELPSSGHQQIDHLAYELAYEYWHKMLFAKFLETNGLLMHPDEVSVTMEECEELAKEAGYIDKWDTAASFASKMLPAIFRPDDPLMQISFAPNDRIKLEEIIDCLDNYIFTADDALGWVYQFWQSEAKEAINKSGDKIDGEKLPAVTQLFTEPYMVHFLIDNTIGAWWVSRNPGVKPPVHFEYLRLLDDGSPAAGKFEGWPDKTAEITALDPCMGSGHFLVSLFMIFVKLRMYEEGLSKEEATDKVIEENLHGLEIDARCTQIAAFNLALIAWKFCGKHKRLPEMNLACSGLAPKGKIEDWVKLVGKEHNENDKFRLENGMRSLYRYFQLAPELGSLIDPTTIEADLHTASFEQLHPVLIKALKSETDKDIVERGVMAAGIAKAGLMLSRKYTLQITNVPYLTIQKQTDLLANYLRLRYPLSKNDLATAFLDKMFYSSFLKGTINVVIPQNWLFLPRYRKFREFLLKEYSWNYLARLGSGAFSQISGEVVKVILLSISKIKPVKLSTFISIDTSIETTTTLKEHKLIGGSLRTNNQLSQINNPDSRILIDDIGTDANTILLSRLSVSRTGTRTADNPRFLIGFWEIENRETVWDYEETSPTSTSLYNAKSLYIRWENEQGSLFELNKIGIASIQGREMWDHKGIAVNLTSLNSSIYLGKVYDMNLGVIKPIDENNLGPIWCFCSSPEFKKEIRKIDQQLKLTTATLGKVPFDLVYWKKISAEKYPNGLPESYSDDSTQWLFHGHPLKSDNPLQVAVIRLLGYRWPAEIDNEMELSHGARHLIEGVKKFNYLTDNDGIICIPSVNTEETAANRLRDYLKEVFGSEWNNNTIQTIIENENAKSSNLENWLRNEFFIHHCKVFLNRPFIWHIWDGRNDGFSALVNYHKLNKENLSKLLYTYLGDWIRMCESKKKSGESGAEGLLSAALKLKEKLELILEGEAPYDIFVRWKPLEQQPIGWDPNLNDGVRLNIRPFIEADVLRKRPNIKWGVDRGKNPPGSPWGEIRDNDRHLTLAEKKAAREK